MLPVEEEREGDALRRRKAVSRIFAFEERLGEAGDVPHFAFFVEVDDGRRR